MTWTPRKTPSRDAYLASDDARRWFRMVMPWRVFFAGFVCVALLIIIVLLASS